MPENREIDSKNSVDKDRLTVKQAIWATFYAFVTYTLVAIFISILITSTFPIEQFKIVFIKFSPILSFFALIALFRYIKAKTNFGLYCLGFRKIGLRKALLAGFFVAIIWKATFLIGKTIKLSMLINNLEIFVSHPAFYPYSWGSVTVGPFFEEVFFRGLWYGVLREKIPKFLAMVFISLVFAIFHPYTKLAPYLGAFLTGIFLTLLYEKTRNLYSSIIAHIFINFFTILFIGAQY